MLNCETKNADRLPDWLKEYPVTLTQFLFYLYHNVMVNLSYFLFAKLFVRFGARTVRRTVFIRTTFN